jgi:hypothetical protein
VQYDNGSDAAFLRWLWHEPYGDEPIDADIITRLKALPEPFAKRLHWKASFDVSRAARVGEWAEALDAPLAALTSASCQETGCGNDRVGLPEGDCCRTAGGGPRA